MASSGIDSLLKKIRDDAQSTRSRLLTAVAYKLKKATVYNMRTQMGRHRQAIEREIPRHPGSAQRPELVYLGNELGNVISAINAMQGLLEPLWDGKKSELSGSEYDDLEDRRENIMTRLNVVAGRADGLIGKFSAASSRSPTRVEARLILPERLRSRAREQAADTGDNRGREEPA